jgi:hypothetical protein
MITWKRFFYISIIVLVAGSSALVGALAGGLAVYTAVRNRLQTAPAAITAPSSSFTSASTPASTPASTIQIETAGVETKIIDAVTQVGPAVVTVVGTIPGQTTFFGPTGDQTVSGSGCLSRRRAIS